MKIITIPLLNTAQIKQPKGPYIPDDSREKEAIVRFLEPRRPDPNAWGGTVYDEIFDGFYPPDHPLRPGNGYLKTPDIKGTSSNNSVHTHVFSDHLDCEGHF